MENVDIPVLNLTTPSSSDVELSSAPSTSNSRELNHERKSMESTSNHEDSQKQVNNFKVDKGPKFSKSPIILKTQETARSNQSRSSKENERVNSQQSILNRRKKHPNKKYRNSLIVSSHRIKKPPQSPKAKTQQMIKTHGVKDVESVISEEKDIAAGSPLKPPHVGGSDCFTKTNTNSFLSRKSVSQIDLKSANRVKILNDSNLRDQISSVGLPQTAPIRQAILRVCMALMINSYRHRRKEVTSLTTQVESLRKLKTKDKAQLHFYQTLFEKEKKDNEELRSQLRASTTTISKMNGEHLELKNKIKVLYLKLKDRKKEIQQIKDETHKSLAVKDNLLVKLQDQLCELESDNYWQKNNAIAFKTRNEELSEQNLRLESAIVALKEEVASKAITLNDAFCYIQVMEKEMSKKTELIDDLMDDKYQLQEENKELLREVTKLNHRLDASLARPIKQFWKYTSALPKESVSWLHWFAFFLLPSIPAPNDRPAPLPFELIMGKPFANLRN